MREDRVADANLLLKYMTSCILILPSYEYLFISKPLNPPIWRWGTKSHPTKLKENCLLNPRLSSLG